MFRHIREGFLRLPTFSAEFVHIHKLFSCLNLFLNCLIPQPGDESEKKKKNNRDDFVNSFHIEL